MTEKIGFFQSLWEKQHGRQYQISAVVSGASTLLFVLSGYQLLFLQNHVDWGDMTGVAIATLVVSGIVMMLSIPTFFVFKGYVATLNEVMEIEGRPELKRRFADADLAAKELGAGFLERWQTFAQENKLYRK